MSPSTFTLALKDGRLVTIQTPAVMEILNLTPNSFYDGGEYVSSQESFSPSLLDKIDRLKQTNVPIIDVGGESSRPGSSPIDAEEELRRVLPVIKRIKKTNKNLLISIDTMKPKVALGALEVGADIINDVSAGTASGDHMLSLAAGKQVPIILTHMQHTPQTMQHNPTYHNVVQEVIQFLKERCLLAQQKGLNNKQIILDPGIGFGKNKEHNISLIQHLSVIKALGYPVLVGASMKQIICDLTQAALPERLPGTLGLHLAACMNGCDLVRVHHPQAMQDALKTFFTGLSPQHV